MNMNKALDEAMSNGERRKESQTETSIVTRLPSFSGVSRPPLEYAMLHLGPGQQR